MIDKAMLEQIRIDRQVREQWNLTMLRICIGKTDDINVPLCMHAAIVAREMAQKGVTVCRVCNKPLPDGVGRFSDHKVLQHPACVQPICTHCAEHNPDAFHLAYKQGIERMESLKKGML